MKRKVLFLTGALKHYRIPILNIIAADDSIELTVAHSGKKMDDGTLLFKELIIKEKKIGPFTFHDKEFLKFCNSFGVVVAMFYLQKLSFMKLLFSRKRSYKIIFWGIGVRASQNSAFDSPTVLNKLRYYIAKKSDAMIFYTDYVAKKYKAQGVSEDKIFVMNNTVRVSNTLTIPEEKSSILFTGTLNKSKKIFSLLNAYNEACKISKSVPVLEIVGSGADFEEVKTWIANSEIKDKIVLHGAIYNEQELEKIFKRSLACISPGQAGLSVLTSFGHGVPFVTSENAITGGERLNIENNYNGYLFSNEKELIDCIIETAENPEKYIQMGKNAKEFYETQRTPEIMAQGFIDAIDFITKKN